MDFILFSTKAGISVRGDNCQSEKQFREGVTQEDEKVFTEIS